MKPKPKAKPRRKSKISLGNSSRRQNKNNSSCGDLVDRISDLPDSILGLILSCLPTKEVVATSILFKRWRFGWVTIHNLDFCYRVYGENDEAKMKFIQFVDRVLLLHDSRILYSFCLDWESDSVSSQVNSWISTAMTKNVNEISLCHEDREVDILYDQDISLCFFNCVSLRYLKLDVYVFVPTSTVFCLPKLERLYLRYVRFELEETFEKLISGCSVLDDLYIHTDDEEFTYKIFSTSLRRLVCTGDSNLKLEASSLEYLNLSGLMSGTFVPKKLRSLVEADFRIIYHYYGVDAWIACNSIVELVRASSFAKFLTLSDDVMQALRCATISLSTEFRRLVKLEVDIECCPWNSLRDFIQNLDNLEDLTIYQDLYGEANHDHHSKWTTPVEVPRCLSNCLKKVCIDGYKGMEDEHGMILYMLKHGRVLEVMQVSCYLTDAERPFKLLQKIRKYPRKSSACKVRLY